jgi:hypothetical protein
MRQVALNSTIVAAPTVAETVDGLPARAWVPQVPGRASSRHMTQFSLYAADRMAWSPRLTLDAGVRLDHLSGRADGATTGLNWTTVSPRVSVRWAAAPFAVFAGAGRYASSHALGLLAHGDPGEAVFDVHRWRDDDGDGTFQSEERGELVSRTGWGQPVASIAADVRAPVTREAIVGVEYTHGASTLRAAILVRRESRVAASENTGVTADDYRVRLVPDQNADYDSAVDDRLLPVYDRLPSSFGRDAFVLMTVDDEPLTYGGVEIGWRFLSNRWSMLFGARAYRTSGRGANRGFGPLENDQHVLGELYHQPNATPEVPGRLFFDRSYVGKWAGSFHASDSWRLAFAARYQDGQPFSRVAVVPDLAAGPDLVQAYRVGQTRFTYTFTLDARVERSFRIGGRPAAVRLDVFNLTNHQNEVNEVVTTGPLFRTSTSVQPPLTLRLGLRVVF